PTADYQVIHKTEREKSKRTLAFPVVVKPSNQGSSLGISIVKNKEDYEKALDDAFSYSDEVVVENFIDGKLLAVGMKGLEPLPIVEIRPKSGFYDYKAKYTPGETEYICPAKLTTKETRECEKTAVSVVRLLKGRGISRVDLILDAQGVPQVLEMNTIPGMTPTSLLPKAAKQAGIDFPELVIEILKMAQLDYEVN
ncbi:MAG: ATP-grasp domain-containing protein, partial [bacterium]|nr:ATP-grasp domain-containing protein [bacterium]